MRKYLREKELLIYFLLLPLLTFKEEIAKRIESAYPPVVTYLSAQGFLAYLNADELSSLIKPLLKTIENVEDQDNRVA